MVGFEKKIWVNMSISDFSIMKLSMKFENVTNHSLDAGNHFATSGSAMPRLSPQDRARAHGMLEAGRSIRDVARHFRVSPWNIGEIRRRYAQTGSFLDRPRSGRPRVTSRRQDRYIVLTHLRDRFRPATTTSAVTIGTHGRPVSGDTVRRRLRHSQLRARRPFRGPILTGQNRERRLQWARNHLRWTRQRWGSVLFSDESRFCCSIADGRRRVWRRRGERYIRPCILSFDRWGGPNVMVWAGISLNFRTPLVIVEGNLTAQRYIDLILRPHVIPFMAAHPDLRIFQQDGARPHAARATRDFLNDEEIQVLNWVPYSPDFNPIEHLWDILGRRVARREPRTRGELIRILQDEWEIIPQAAIRELIRSMRNRCVEAVAANGGHTRY